MDRFVRTATFVLAALALTAGLAGCTRGYAPERVDTVAACGETLSDLVSAVRSGGDVSGATVDGMARTCPDEYDILTDYFSAEGQAEGPGPLTCDELEQYLRSEAIALLEQDGSCERAAAAAESSWPNDGIGWDEAYEYAGATQRVCGPLMSMRDTDDGTFVNVGRDYPSTDRFTFIFWDAWLEPIASGTTVCGAGVIYMYDGVVAQMELDDPSALEIWQ